MRNKENWKKGLERKKGKEEGKEKITFVCLNGLCYSKHRKKCMCSSCVTHKNAGG